MINITLASVEFGLMK